ncbi:hypothetical protein Hanom_Chr11g01044651 [Helianthus anomalus]
MAVKYGNPSSLSMIVVSNEGTTAFSTENTVLVLKVRFFTSENASSLGTYTSLLLNSDNGSAFAVLFSIETIHKI